jgi:predicted DCC family thiol-disulfide oxidoreductase YuxK
LSKYNASPDSFDSIVLIEETAYYIKSTAVLRIVKQLGGLWALGYYMFILVPQAWRDRVYDFVAANRYKWFGQTDRCVIPQPASGDRFLD